MNKNGCTNQGITSDNIDVLNQKNNPSFNNFPSIYPFLT